MPLSYQPKWRERGILEERADRLTTVSQGGGRSSHGWFVSSSTRSSNAAKSKEGLSGFSITQSTVQSYLEIVLAASAASVSSRRAWNLETSVRGDEVGRLFHQCCSKPTHLLTQQSYRRTHASAFSGPKVFSSPVSSISRRPRQPWQRIWCSGAQCRLL